MDLVLPSQAEQYLNCSINSFMINIHLGPRQVLDLHHDSYPKCAVTGL